MLKVLVVDDDADIRLTVSSALSENRARVDQVHDAQEAITRLRAERYDLVLVDVRPPEMKGLMTIREIKIQDPSILVLLLTATSNGPEPAEAAPAGACDSFKKAIRAETQALASTAGGDFALHSEGKGFQLEISHLDFQANKEEFERRFLTRALQAFKGRINQTALHANIPKKTLLRKLSKYGINARDYG